VSYPWAHTWRERRRNSGTCAICRKPLQERGAGFCSLWLGTLYAPAHIECIAHELRRAPANIEDGAEILETVTP
jgi:hypothetical protein